MRAFVRTRRGLAAVVAFCAMLGVAIPAQAAPESAPFADGPVVEPAAKPASIVRNGVFFATDSLCGRVQLFTAIDRSDPTLASRLPINIFVSEPSRGLARTFVTTYDAASTASDYSDPIFVPAPSGRGPGLVVSVEWAGGTETVTTEDYVDQCPGEFFPVTPSRLLDTRTGTGMTGALPAKVQAGTSIVVDPAASGAIPALAVTAVVLNVTATDPSSPGYLTVYPCGQNPPNASNLNFGANRTVPNLVVVDLVGFPATGTVCIFSSATTNILADVTGYFLAGINGGGRINALASPQRVLDTRATAKIAGGTVQRVPMAGVSGIPATGVTGVAMNVTAVNALGAGYLTVFPCGTDQPNASTVNYLAGAAVPNAAVVGLTGDGGMCVFASATTDVIIDVAGYYAAAGLMYMPDAPTRIWDNRLDVFSGLTAPRKLGPSGTFRFGMSLPVGTVVTLNVTVIDADTAGYATLYPCDQGAPNSSNLNYQANEAIANTVMVRVDAARQFCLFTSGRINFILDINGTSMSIPA